MLESVKIQRRQSEIRQALADLVGKETPTEDETRSMTDLDSEYRTNETRYRAALVAEDDERRTAGADLETRSEREWAGMMAGFELRQVAAALDHGHKIDGVTAEIVSELRSGGAYQGIPVPWEALELRAGETVSSDRPAPTPTRPIIDRLFPDSVAAQTGAQMISIGHGEVEWPVVTQGTTVAWQADELGSVGGPQPFQTTDRALAPNNTLGVQMKISRKSLKQSGAALEQAVRRDMNAAMQVEIDRVTFLGSGSNGEPLGVVAGAATYGITETDLGDMFLSSADPWRAFRDGVIRFIIGNAASGPGEVTALVRPEVWGRMDNTFYDPGSGITHWDRLVSSMNKVVMSHNALADPSGSPAVVSSLLTTSAGGVAPIFVGQWGAVDMIRDPYSDAASGGLRVTALATLDVTVARPAQLEVLTGYEV